MAGSLSEVIKKMAVRANETTAPTAIFFGTVSSINPLEIYIEPKLILTQEFLTITKSARDSMLNVNDKVLILQQQGATNFIVVDKI